MHIPTCKEIKLTMSYCEEERGKGRVIMWQGVCCNIFFCVRTGMPHTGLQKGGGCCG